MKAKFSVCVGNVIYNLGCAAFMCKSLLGIFFRACLSHLAYYLVTVCLQRFFCSIKSWICAWLGVWLVQPSIINQFQCNACSECLSFCDCGALHESNCMQLILGGRAFKNFNDGYAIISLKLKSSISISICILYRDGLLAKFFCFNKSWISAWLCAWLCAA